VRGPRLEPESGGAIVDQIDLQPFAFGVGAAYLGEVNGTSAANSAFGGTAGETVLDISVNQVLVDVDGSGDVNTGDLVIELPGIVDLDAGNFIF
jgi:hypothetical protein